MTRPAPVTQHDYERAFRAAIKLNVTLIIEPRSGRMILDPGLKPGESVPPAPANVDSYPANPWDDE